MPVEAEAEVIGWAFDFFADDTVILILHNNYLNVSRWSIGGSKSGHAGAGVDGGGCGK